MVTALVKKTDHRTQMVEDQLYKDVFCRMFFLKKKIHKEPQAWWFSSCLNPSTQKHEPESTYFMVSSNRAGLIFGLERTIEGLFFCLFQSSGPGFKVITALRWHNGEVLATKPEDLSVSL